MKMLKEGAVYKYHNKKGTYQGMQIHEGIATIFLQNNDTQEVIKKDCDKIEEWLKEFELISLPSTPAVSSTGEINSLPVIKGKESTLIEQLRDNLMEDIKRVREDKGYIPQAKQACNTTNTLINLVKTEILMSRRG